MEPLLIALALAGGVCAGVLVEHGRRRGRIGDAEREAQRILEDARRQADAQVKEARVTAREDLLAQRTEQEEQSRVSCPSRVGHADLLGSSVASPRLPAGSGGHVGSLARIVFP